MSDNDQKLIAAGILLQDGQTNFNKINLISGVITLPLVRTMYEGAAGDMDSVQKMHDILSDLFFSGQYQELYESIEELYSNMGFQIGETFSLICENHEALVYFLKSFLLDFEDIMKDYRFEKSAG